MGLIKKLECSDSASDYSRVQFCLAEWGDISSATTFSIMTFSIMTLSIQSLLAAISINEMSV